MQLEEERPADPAGLVPCPGCERCNKGYIVHLYAGRPTSAHEHVFLLTKRARYFFDSIAIRERVGEETRRNTEFRGESTPYKNNQSYDNSAQIKNYAPADEPSLNGRSCRNVWTIATHAYPQAHFATFPPELAERCIKAGTSERGCCAQCGAPWVRVTAQTKSWREDAETAEQSYGPGSGNRRIRSSNGGMSLSEYQTTGWRASCACDAATVPCTVLDPFIGAGTTALVSDRLGRDCIGIDLNVAYTEMAMERVRADAPLFVDIDAGPMPEHPVETEIADLFAEAAE